MNSIISGKTTNARLFNLSQSELDLDIVDRLLSIYDELIILNKKNRNISNKALRMIDDISSIFQYLDDADELYFLTDELSSIFFYLSEEQITDYFEALFEDLTRCMEQEVRFNYNYFSYKEAIDGQNLFSHSINKYNEKNTVNRMSQVLNGVIPYTLSYFSYDECKNDIFSYMEKSTGLVSIKELEEKIGHKINKYNRKILKQDFLIDFKGMYLYKDNLKINKKQEICCLKIIEKYLNKEKIVHIDNVYEAFINNVPHFMSDNHINTSYALFSVLKYLFYRDFNFKRPYISRKTFKIESRNKMLEDYILSQEKTSITEVNEFLRKLNFSEIGMINIVENMIDDVALVNKNTIKRWKDIEINKKMVNEIECLIDDELLYNETKALIDLDCTYYFPEINEDWDEWFIYCILKKYSNLLTVGSTSRQLKKAIPVVSKNKIIKQYELEYIEKIPHNIVIQKRIDDVNLDEIELEDIDELLMEEWL